MRILNFLFQPMFLFDEKKEGEGGGPDPVEALKTQNAELLKRLEALEGKSKPPPEDPDLLEKAKKEREEKEAKGADAKALEAALRFTMGSKEWVKNNGSLLPKDIEGVITNADKETYDSAVEKAGAVQSSILQSFFQVQENLDLLTPSQKTAIEEFLKLTKNGKQVKAPTLYDSIFEPTFEMLKRIKKAEQLNSKDKFQSDGEKALAERMMTLSKKHYLGDK
jgi:hypothetical protein